MPLNISQVVFSIFLHFVRLYFQKGDHLILFIISPYLRRPFMSYWNVMYCVGSVRYWVTRGYCLSLKIFARVIFLAFCRFRTISFCEFYICNFEIPYINLQTKQQKQNKNKKKTKKKNKNKNKTKQHVSYIRKFALIQKCMKCKKILHSPVKRQ